MKISSIRLALAAALVLPFFAGCSKETTNAAENTAASATKDMKELGTKVANQFDALKKSAQDKMPAVESAMTDLKQKAGAATGEARVKLEEVGQKLAAKKDELSKTVADMDVKGKTADAYAAAKVKVDALMVEISQLVEKAKNM